MSKKNAETADKSTAVTVAPPDLRTGAFRIEGTAPYVQHKFSQKARQAMLATQQAGSRAKSKKQREARDLDEAYRGAMHLGPRGEYGIPAPAFRAALISACRLVGFQMTKAKLAVFVEPDFFDADDGTPMVAIVGEPRMHEATVRLATGVASVAIRPMWMTWSATVRITYDYGQFTDADIANLLMRVGAQVGIGEGRPDSKSSAGCGWGTFRVL